MDNTADDSRTLGGVSRPTTQSVDAPISSRNKPLIWLILFLAVANGVFLYFLPWLAETLYAWPIKPPVSAAFMGAGYLGGMTATALSAFVVKQWRSVRPILWPFFLLGLSLFITTLLHADRFFWSYPLTWGWTLVYFVLPFGVLYVWFTQERDAAPAPPLDPRIQPLQLPAYILGGIVTLLALALFFRPDLLIPAWPWTITPLLARAYSGWYFLIGPMLLFTALLARRPSEIIATAATNTAISFLMLLLPLLYSGSFNFGNLGFWLWLLLNLALFAFPLYSLIRGVTLARGADGKLVF